MAKTEEKISNIQKEQGNTRWQVFPLIVYFYQGGVAIYRVWGSTSLVIVATHCTILEGLTVPEIF